jgi:hypothetical protein
MLKNMLSVFLGAWIFVISFILVAWVTWPIGGRIIEIVAWWAHN